MVSTEEGAPRPSPSPPPSAGQAGAGGDAGGRRRPTPRRRPLLGVGIFGLYLLPAIVSFWHCLPHLATVEPQLGGGDLAKYNWCVAWVPFALGHGHNPFFTHYANAPYGVNLMDDTSVLGLGLIMSPVTVLFGPFATVNVLLILAYPLSAGAAYLLARRYVGWRPAAFAAGLLYGYSPYMVGQGYGHLNLSFVPIPPLVFLLLDELFIRQRRNPTGQGLLLGGLMAVQFMISTEIFATTVMFAVIWLVLVAVLDRRDGRLDRPDLRRRLTIGLRGLAPGAALAAVLLAWPAYEALLGPRHIHGAIAGFRTYFNALAGPVLPTSLMLFGTHHLKTLGDGISFGGSENGSYLGVPLVLLCLITPFAVKRRGVRVAAAMAAIAFVLSLGVRLHIGLAGTAAATRYAVLPGVVIYKIPLLQDSFPIRYTLYVALAVSVVLAFALQAVHDRCTGARRAALPALLAVVVLLPLVPKWPAAYEGRVPVPTYFTTSAVDRLSPGEVTLVYPVAVPTNSYAMDWQAMAGFRFAMPGGYFVLPKSPSGSQFVLPSATEEDLTALSAGRAVPRTAQIRAQLRGELRAWGVTAVVAQPVGADPVGFLGWLIGRPPDAQAGGMIEWYHLSWAASR